MVSLLKTTSETRPYEDKINIKSFGPDTPDLHLTQTGLNVWYQTGVYIYDKWRGKKTERKFNPESDITRKYC